MISALCVYTPVCSPSLGLGQSARGSGCGSLICPGTQHPKGQWHPAFKGCLGVEWCLVSGGSAAILTSFLPSQKPCAWNDHLTGGLKSDRALWGLALGKSPFFLL